MATKYLLSRDVAGYPTTGEQTSVPFSNTGAYFQLTPGVPTNVTVPPTFSTNVLARFSYGNGIENPVVFVKNGASPVISFPSTSVQESDIEINPSARQVKSGDVIQFLSSQTNISVSVSFYEIL